MEVERHLALRFRDDAIATSLSEPVFERTQGQPLFIASLIKFFIDQRVIVETDGAWRLPSEAAIPQDGIPTDLLNMINYQVGRLTEDERRSPAWQAEIFPLPWWQPACHAMPSRLSASWKH
jgi:predicted ATPase